MADEFVLSKETMNEIQAFSAKLEQLRFFSDFVDNFVWREISGRNYGKES